MYVPTRLLYALRPHAPPGLVAATVGIAFMFSATPFLIPELSKSFDVSEGLAGAVSVAQVGAFALANFLGPRFLSPGRTLFRRVGIGFVGANLLSAFVPTFAVLLAVRVLAGLAAGTLTWIAWGEAMRHPRSLSTIASSGPVTALISAPILSVIAELGDQAVYLALAVVAIPVVGLAVETSPVGGGKRAVSRSRSNRVLLAALFLLVFAGSSLFIYLAVAVREVVGISPVAASFGFSLNAFGGLLGVRFSSRHRRPGWWLATAGPAAFLSIAGGSPVWYFAGLFWWGFAFWMGVPGVLQMLSQRSLEPGERAGDAQGVMAAGRALGPVLGGGLTDGGAFQELALVAGLGISLSGATVMAVQEGREHLPPTRPLEVG